MRRCTARQMSRSEVVISSVEAVDVVTDVLPSSPRSALTSCWPPVISGSDGVEAHPRGDGGGAASLGRCFSERPFRFVPDRLSRAQPLPDRSSGSLEDGPFLQECPK